MDPFHSSETLPARVLLPAAATISGSRVQLVTQSGARPAGMGPLTWSRLQNGRPGAPGSSAQTVAADLSAP